MISSSKSEKETLGQELRRLREQRGWTLEAAAQITKIKAEQLHDLEADNYDNFHSTAYVRGFVRIYARALGLDDRKVLAKLEGRIEDEEGDLANLPPLESMPPVTKVRQPTMRRIGSQIIGLTVITVIIGIVFVLWRIGSNFKGYPTGPQVAEVPRALPVREDIPIREPSKKSSHKKSIAPPNIPRATVVKPKPLEPVIPRAEVIQSPSLPPPVVNPVAVAQVPVAEVVSSSEVRAEIEPVATETNQLEAPRAEVVVKPQASLQLQATDEVWVRVIVNGDESRPAYDGVMAPGQNGVWQGERFYIVARPASALMATVNGQALGQLSQSSARQEFTFP